MSASFYELLRYAKTGIASPDMTAYDKLMALRMHGSLPITTITGITPISFNSDGHPLAAWSISGNSRQDGTPAPDDPIYPDFVGERTENLFDKDNFIDGGGFYPVGSSSSLVESANTDILLIPCKPSTQYTVSRSEITKRFMICFTETADLEAGTPVYNLTGSAGYVPEQAYELSAQSGADSKYLLIYYAKHAGTDSSTAEEIQSCLNTLMVVEGATAPDSYIPYGYKISLTSAGQTRAVYLGQVPTTRRVRKLALTGEEDWIAGANKTYYITNITDYLRWSEVPISICSHYESQAPVLQASLVSDMSLTFFKTTSGGFSRLYIRDTSLTTAEAFKAHLAAQYAAGIPVTVWYVLAETETAAINEPLCKIGTYADTLDSTAAGVTILTVKGQNILTVESELQPSEMTITGHIKPV